MLSHIVVFTSDLDSAERFYAGAFGLRTAWKRNNDKAYLTSGRGDILGILEDAEMKPSSEMTISQFLDHQGNTEKFHHFGFTFWDEVDYTQQRRKLDELGIECSSEHTSRDGTRSCFLFDRDRNVVQIILLSDSYFDGHAEVPK
jgi:catechol 2,3-dioxygenase-like lactoylglutathione lyase family enzyme